MHTLTDSRPAVVATMSSCLQGKRVGMVVYSSYPADPRPRRAVDTLLKEGMMIDLICLGDENQPRRETLEGLEIFRVPIKHSRGGKLSYAYQYSAFILASSAILAARACKRKYDLVHVHNMPDVLVVSALIPKMLGAKVILDQHDPMPELMKTIFGLDETSSSVRLLTWLEKWSIARSDLVITVNLACKRIFGSRSCSPTKVGVVMNAPDGEIFPFRAARSYPQPADRTNQPFVMMYHGSIVERNGLDLAVDALEEVRKTVPTAVLKIYGRKTPFLDQVMDKANAMGLKDYVHYLGPRSLEGLRLEIEACDVGVVPNPLNAFTEINTPTRIFEYLALGKPVAAPRTAGIEDYFTEDSLLFFEPGDSKELAGKVEGVFFDYNKAVESTERGQQVYMAHTWSQEKQTLVNLVSGLLKETN